ncbi:formyltransferase family protein [Roseibium sp. SCP14]|uniref:formyltransferase family protein n=1 Tax=Roseibium sp. SCP14 TaxID=3141375 RepID=UPI00333D49B5
MGDVTKDAWLNNLLEEYQLADSVYDDTSIRWGEFIQPASDPRPNIAPGILRLAVIGSMPVGFLMLKTLLSYARQFPDKLHIACLLTDDVANPEAKIGVRKRIWHVYPEDVQRRIEFATIKSALDAGIPVYTGDIKTDWFRETFSELKPDAVICCGYGQLIDGPILEIPRLGIYNLHPADLAHGFGAGPAMYDDSRSRNAISTCWTVHLMNEALDAGPIVGSSPPINIRMTNGDFPESKVDYYTKVMDGLDYLTFHTISSLIDWHLRGHTMPMTQVDFAALFPSAIKRWMMEPVREFPEHIVPDPALFE